MHIKGKFRDVLKKEGKVIEDRAWKSNRIVPDFGNFLAALMKKDFKDANEPVGIGIEYIAVGCGSNNKSDYFKNNVIEFFNRVDSGIQNSNEPYTIDSNPDKWVWAKKIDDGEIAYFDGEKTVSEIVTNMLEIAVTFDISNPNSETPLKFEEFALFGYHDQGTQTNEDTKLFFVNYATHGTITKEQDMTLKRTIRLEFPIKQV